MAPPDYQPHRIWKILPWALGVGLLLYANLKRPELWRTPEPATPRQSLSAALPPGYSTPDSLGTVLARYRLGVDSLWRNWRDAARQGHTRPACFLTEWLAGYTDPADTDTPCTSALLPFATAHSLLAVLYSQPKVRKLLLLSAEPFHLGAPGRRLAAADLGRLHAQQALLLDPTHWGSAPQAEPLLSQLPDSSDSLNPLPLLESVLLQTGWRVNGLRAFRLEADGKLAYADSMLLRPGLSGLELRAKRPTGETLYLRLALHQPLNRLWRDTGRLAQHLRVEANSTPHYKVLLGPLARRTLRLAHYSNFRRFLQKLRPSPSGEPKAADR